MEVPNIITRPHSPCDLRLRGALSLPSFTSGNTEGRLQYTKAKSKYEMNETASAAANTWAAVQETKFSDQNMGIW